MCTVNVIITLSLRTNVLSRNLNTAIKGLIYQTQLSEYLNPCRHATTISNRVQYTVMPTISHCHKESVIAVWMGG